MNKNVVCNYLYFIPPSIPVVMSLGTTDPSILFDRDVAVNLAHHKLTSWLNTVSLNCPPPTHPLPFSEHTPCHLYPPHRMCPCSSPIQQRHVAVPCPPLSSSLISQCTQNSRNEGQSTTVLLPLNNSGGSKSRDIPFTF
jgi:hypothetical protein